ncbi:MAG: hypothetical protein KF764_09770 [Labilithrix sp.]|nr:hypothetical protein [Labilithrix sp.]MBX3221944.1 hypothetical protein [Labilithrix sp.]
MGVFRVTLVAVVGATLLATVPACSSREPAPTSEPELEDQVPVPDPPPRYKRSMLDAGIDVPDEGDDAEPTLQIKCGGYQPYVCSLDDGTFRCSDRPCVPDCDRVGCLGADVCRACEGGFRCLASGETC